MRSLSNSKSGHDGPHELATGGAEVEAQAGLRQDAHLPAVKVIERLHEVLGASAPARQLGHEDGVDLARLGEVHDLLAFNAVVLGA